MKNAKKLRLVVALLCSISTQCAVKKFTIKNQTTSPLEYVVRSVGCAKILRGKTLACSKEVLAPDQSKEISLSWITTGKAEVVVFSGNQEFRTGMTLQDGTALVWPESFGEKAVAWVSRSSALSLPSGQATVLPHNSTLQVIIEGTTLRATIL